MRLDKFGNPIFNDKDMFAALYRGYELSPDMIVDHSDDIESLEEQIGFNFHVPLQQDFLSVEDFDAKMQAEWNMPREYKELDIESFLVQHSDKQHYDRLMEELGEFKERNMLDLLRWIKYFVDTCEKNNIVWGVGRGSSVASYVLYILGVHSIDPIKYNLDWREFLR